MLTEKDGLFSFPLFFVAFRVKSQLSSKPAQQPAHWLGNSLILHHFPPPTPTTAHKAIAVLKLHLS